MLLAMSEATKLLKEALRLPAEARAALAAKLIDSLDAEVDEDAEARWAEEIERRLAEVDAGHVTPVAWSEVRAAILRS
jgi:putative addiction module component (TIGR02574 family)